MGAARLIHRLREWAHCAGAAPAVVDQHGAWSYAELLARAEHGALGIGAGEVVPIALPPSREAIAALFAAHAAGAAFFFVDGARSEESQRALLADIAAAEPDDRLAYIVGTSGSSGRAKAVRVGHDGIMPMLDAQIAAFGLGPGKRALLGTPLCFDASISDIGTALASGATLHIPPCRTDPARLAAYIAESRVTHADLPPVMLGLVDPPSCLECVVVGGEVVPPATLRRWARHTRVVVSYGPTEATVCTSMVEVDASRWEAPSIGRPLAHVQYLAMEEELWIAGPLALGYASQPELEGQRFVVHEGRRWFRTGDRVRRTDAGEWIFAGRLDRQRKIGGRLVCPEEIEAVLASCGVRDPSVVVRAIPRAGLPPRQAAVAYVGGERDLARVRAALGRHLPAGMIPHLVAREVPRTPSGKPDLSRMIAEELHVAEPSGEVVARAMARVLGVARLGPDDDFVEHGGDSLAALELVAELEQDGVVLAADAVLAGRTARRLAGRAGVSATPAAAILDSIAPDRAELSRVRARPPSTGADAFFTGATGSFGPRLVSAWLARGPGKALCLVRASTAGAGWTRIEQAWARHGLPAADLKRVEVIVGDVSRRLDPTALRIGAVVHAAARLDVTLPFSALARDNVRGTLEAARLALTTGARLHLVSTLAVILAGTECPSDIDEATPRASAVSGGYTASKWAAEALLDGLVDAHVHRLGLLTGSTTSTFSAVVRGLAALRVAPAGPHEELRFDLTDVDDAAAAVAATLRDPPADRRIWHISTSRGLSLADLCRALAQEGRPLSLVAPAELAAAARSSLTIDGARALLALSHRLSGRAHRPDLNLFLLTGRRLRAAANVPPADLGAEVRRILGTPA